MQLLWYEYKRTHPNGLQYSQFCHLYRQWASRLNVSLRQTYRAGEKLRRLRRADHDDHRSFDPVRPGKPICSSPPWVPAAILISRRALRRTLPSLISTHVRAFQFLSGVPEIIVPDNLKAGISKPCRYEPDINPNYHDMARHYGTLTRVAKPRDKAKVERRFWLPSVGSWNHTFFSLAELNCAIAEKLTEFNDRKFQRMDTTRRIFFETINKPALKPLPALAVNIDYHIEIDGHYYSVPYQLVRQQVDVRLTYSTMENLHKSRRVAAHPRSALKGRHTTSAEHMPKSHRKYLENRKHPEQGFRSCLGIMRLAKRYTPERLEAACARALLLKAYSYKSVESILKQGLDREIPGRESHSERLRKAWAL